MKICLIGNNLTNYILSKIFFDKNINIDLYCSNNNIKKLPTRTIGISHENMLFLRKICNDIEKILWPINNIKIYNETNYNEIINFNSHKEPRFYIVEHDRLLKYLSKYLERSSTIKKKLKRDETYLSISKKKDYDLIINCEKNDISKKYFEKNISKNYSDFAYTCLIKHKSLQNNLAVQIFTKFGPLAFLPVSKNVTSIVFSFYKEKKFNEKEIKDLIRSYNKKYKILKFSKIDKFSLSFILPRKYFYENILFFGDNLHKIHPLAGQGFNMTIRDIKMLSNLVDNKIDLGLPLDKSLPKEFENKTKHLNFIFASSIDLIKNIFQIDSKNNNFYSNKILNILSNNKLFKKYSTEFANKGF